ncbi:MAG: ArsA-related P-loop ATPase [Aeromicrobium sp.]|uniref:ArsA-related P-loop ATPase n=1 Tax=Aeromicrobium sp. TaxID=1871063 RepID=UPI003C331437
MAIASDLHIVTGKGGTGKTTVAAALAMSLAGTGRRVLLCEVEGRQGIAQLFDVAPLPYEERKIAVGPTGGEVYALAIDPESALLEYLQMFYRLGRAGRALDRFGIIDFATTIAPGVRDVLLTGKVYEAAKRETGDRFVYDAVVLDAPPTGRITRFLNVNSELAGLAKVGPIRRQADSIMQMMRAPSTHVHLVTVLEEMPVTETIDAIAELGVARLPVGHVVVNLIQPDLITEPTRAALAADTLDADAIGAVLDRAGLPASAAGSLIDGGLDAAHRAELQGDQRAALEHCGRPVIELDRRPDGIDLGALYEMSDQLKDLT